DAGQHHAAAGGERERRRFDVAVGMEAVERPRLLLLAASAPPQPGARGPRAAALHLLHGVAVGVEVEALEIDLRVADLGAAALAQLDRPCRPPGLAGIELDR